MQKLAGALQGDLRESEASMLFLHEVAVSVLDDFTGLGPLCESVSSGLEAVVRTNVRLTEVFYYKRTDSSYKEKIELIVSVFKIAFVYGTVVH